MKEQFANLLTNFKNILPILRKEAGLTQKQVANALNISHQSYQAYETGAAVPTLQNFIKLAIFFDVTADYLLGIIS